MRRLHLRHTALDDSQRERIARIRVTAESGDVSTGTRTRRWTRGSARAIENCEKTRLN